MIFSREYFSHSFVTRRAKHQNKKRNVHRVSKAKLLEKPWGYQDVLLPLQDTIRTRDRRKYCCRKVEVRRKAKRFAELFVFLGYTEGPFPLSPPPFHTIRFIRKSCTRNRRSRERATHVRERNR